MKQSCVFQAELLQSLEDDDLHNFTNYISAAQESGADLNHQYGGESGYKTILHLALEEDDGLPYVEELLKVLPGQTRRESLRFGFFCIFGQFLEHRNQVRF